MKTHYVEYLNGYRVYVSFVELRVAFTHKRKPMRCGSLYALCLRLCRSNKRRAA